MKLKKLVSLALVGSMALSLVACGSSDNAGSTNSGSKTETKTENTASASGEVTNLVLWTWNNDALKFAQWFNETHTDIQVEAINVASSGEYETKVQTALLAGEKEPDIIGCEMGWFDLFVDAGFFADLNQFGAQDYADLQFDYVWELGQDDNGVQRCISYQVTPAGFYYRNDIAEAIFGYSDPESVSKLFASYDAIMEAAKVAKSKGYRLFASDSELGYCQYNEPWVVDGVVNLNSERVEKMEMTAAFYQEGLTAYAAQWTTPWYQSMSGSIPVLEESVMWGTDDLSVWSGDSEEGWEAFEAQAAALGYTDTTEVMAFGMPTWGNLILSSHAGDTYGNWGFVAGPTAAYGGGGWMGISELSEKKDAAWEFIKWMTLNEETLEKWYQEGGDQGDGGDAVSLKSLYEKHFNDENPSYNNQKLYAEWSKIAEGIDFSIQTKYDTTLNDLWGTAIANYKTGEMTKEEAIDEFYNQVEATYAGEITVNR